ncbi:unnamed protein product [Clonostachys solani]|uniref:LDB19 N-terminal domain-containing protein n=1 Tax=Clonostachys solani TaxID=160281 RepID=A0A9N9W8W9_9HYPO|nr:unnamed protein product [Clonostachys solani]
MGFTSKLLAPARSQKQTTTREPTSLEWALQTPTPTLIDGVEAFTGAPVIGEIILDNREALDVNKFCTTLHLHRYYKNPLHPRCFHCAHHYVELKQWVSGDLQNVTFSFPDASIDADLRMKQVIEPNGINSVWLSLSAIKNLPERGKYIWEPTKVEWKFEETIEATLGTCTTHSEDQDNAPNSRKQTVTHTLAKGRIHSGWRSGQGAQGSSSTLKFEYGPISEVATKRKTTFACDEAINNMLTVSHALVVEISLSAVTMLLDEAAGSLASNSSRIIRLRRPVVITEPRNDLESVDDTLPRYTNVQLDLPAYEEP